MQARTNIDSVHDDICVIEKYLANAQTEEARKHYDELLALAQKRLSDFCKLRESFYSR